MITWGQCYQIKSIKIPLHTFQVLLWLWKCSRNFKCWDYNEGKPSLHESQANQRMGPTLIISCYEQITPKFNCLKWQIFPISHSFWGLRIWEIPRGWFWFKVSQRDASQALHQGCNNLTAQMGKDQFPRLLMWLSQALVLAGHGLKSQFLSYGPLHGLPECLSVLITRQLSFPKVCDPKEFQRRQV